MAESGDQRDQQNRSSDDGASARDRRERSGSGDKRERSDSSSRERSRSMLPSVQVIGWAFVLLILAGYFAWMIVEMGAHAVTKAWPMLGVFVAAVAGGVAATLGLLIGRRGNDT